MSRIPSTGTQVMIQDNDVSPTYLGIASATKAHPSVLTLVAGTAPVQGDIIVPRNTGWTSIEGRPFKVKAVAGQAVTLEDSDTRNEPNNIRDSADTPPARVEFTTWLELCRSTVNIVGPAGPVIDVTTMCDEQHRTVPGLPAIATWTANGFYDQADAALAIARDAYRSGKFTPIDIRYRDGTGVTFMGSVMNFEMAMGVNVAVTLNLGGNIDGGVCWYKTPAPGFVVSAALVPPAPAPVMEPA